MTDEQAALIAAAIAQRDDRRPQAGSPGDLDGLADSIATLTRSLYFDLRALTEHREHSDLLERLGHLSDLIHRREAAR